MSIEQTLAFLGFATVVAITPGPSNVMLTVTGAVAGILRGLPCLVGVATSMALVMFAVSFGLGAMILGHPTVVAVLKWCGAAFLLWLSWKIATAAYGGAPDQGRPVGFREAFVFQWLNPKAWLVSTSASAAYLQAGGGALIQALWIAGLFFIVALPCGFVWLGFGAGVRGLLKSPERQRAFNVAMGALLASSVVLFVS